MLGKKKAPKPPGRLEQEEIDLYALYQAIDREMPFKPKERLKVEIDLAMHKRMGEMIRHLQEIEGRAHRGRF